MTFDVEDEDDPVIRAKVYKSNTLGQFDMEFNKFIAAPRNLTTWSSSNEGAERINIWLLLSDETKGLLEEQELHILLSWHLVDANIKEFEASYQGRRRLTQDSSSDEATLPETEPAEATSHTDSVDEDDP